MLEKEIRATLALYQDPYLKKDLLQAGAISRLTVNQDQIIIDIILGYPFQRIEQTIKTNLGRLLAPFAASKKIVIHLSSSIEVHTGKSGLKALPEVKNIIAVASGKGGVGKSTVAVNLALALKKEGATVGLLDADIYGPSQPTMLGVLEEKPVILDKQLHPILRHGIQSMSIGYLIDQNTPMVWRGPMIGKALQQLLHDTKWDKLDYLIVDLPPGTGDIQLTLCQKIPVSGVVMVTTPQDLALLDVARACEMFNKLNVPLLGVIENMSTYHCSKCGHAAPIFGEGGGEKLAQQYGISMLGAIPLDLRIRETTDSGVPPVMKENGNEYAEVFYEIAKKVAAEISLQPKDYSARFPKVVVETKI